MHKSIYDYRLLLLTENSKGTIDYPRTSYPSCNENKVIHTYQYHRDSTDLRYEPVWIGPRTPTQTNGISLFRGVRPSSTVCQNLRLLPPNTLFVRTEYSGSDWVPRVSHWFWNWWSRSSLDTDSDMSTDRTTRSDSLNDSDVENVGR